MPSRRQKQHSRQLRSRRAKPQHSRSRQQRKDRRSVRISLTDTGRSLAEEKIREALRLTAGMLKQLGHEETEALLRIYRKMTEITDMYLSSCQPEKKETK